MTKAEILAAIDKVIHTDRAWRGIRREVETGRIDKARAERLHKMHSERLANGDERSRRFVPLWKGILDLATGASGPQSAAEAQSGAQGGGGAQTAAPSAQGAPGAAEAQAAKTPTAEATGKAIGDQALRDAVEARAIDAIGKSDAGKWEAVVQRLSGTGGMTTPDLVVWRGEERAGDDFDLLGRVIDAINAAFRKEAVDADEVIAEVKAHIAGGVKGRWADVLRRLEGDFDAIRDHEIERWYRYGRRGAARLAVEGTLPKVGKALQAMRDDERQQYDPVVYSGASMPDSFYGNAANKAFNSDGVVLQLPPKGWQFEIIGQRAEVSDGGLKMISPYAFNRPLPHQTCRVYNVPPKTPYRCRLRWRKDSRSDWLMVDSPDCTNGEISDRIHALGMAYSGNFGGCALPDPVDWQA